MGILEELDSLKQFEPIEYEFMHPPNTFELLSFKVVVKEFNTKYGIKPYTYLDSEPKYLLSRRGSEDIASFLEKEEIECPQHIKMKETNGIGYDMHYIFVKIKPPKQLNLDEPTK